MGREDTHLPLSEQDQLDCRRMIVLEKASTRVAWKAVFRRWQLHVL